MISIIIRTKNEERWITRCLQKIKTQNYKDFEVILVDNNSTDKTVEKAFHVFPDIKLIEVKRYLPGLVLNEGIRASSGDYIVCLSAHCLPAREDWLANLLRNFSDPMVAGVYGRQIPMRFTSPADKRDLIITFGLDRRVHKKDSFFHNANSMIRRSIWEKYPFDEEVTNIEDRVWGKKVIEQGYTLIYEPEAPVFHHHGIHQTNDRERYDGVIRILDGLDITAEDTEKDPLDPANLNIIALIPIRQHNNKGSIDENEGLVLKTVNAALNSGYINQVIISADSEAMARKAQSWGAYAPFVRPVELSSDNVRVDDVLKYSLIEIEKQGIFPDLVVPLEVTYPFRPEGLLDKLIEQHLEQGLDTTIAGLPDYRPCWIRRDEGLVRVDDYSQTREKRMPILIGLPSLGCVTFPEYIRRGTRLGEKVGIYEVSDSRSGIEVRSKEDFEKVAGWLYSKIT